MIRPHTGVLVLVSVWPVLCSEQVLRVQTRVFLNQTGVPIRGQWLRTNAEKLPAQLVSDLRTKI